MYKYKISLLYIFIISIAPNLVIAKNIKHVLFFDYRNESTVRLNLGVDSLATDYYDKTLGEQDIPPLPPPDAVIPVFEILDTAINEIKYSQYEYKKLENGVFSKTFLIRLLGNAQEDFRLSVKGLPEGIDSLIVKDKINGNIFRWVVNQSAPKDTTMLRFFSQFAIDVYYNSDKITSVENSEDYPDNYADNNNLVADYLNSKINIIDNKIEINDKKINLLEVFDILGNKINFDDNLNIDNINKNKIIFLYIEYNNKRQLIKKII